MPSTKPQTRDPARPAPKDRAAALKIQADRVMPTIVAPAALLASPADLADRILTHWREHDAAPDSGPVYDASYERRWQLLNEADALPAIRQNVVAKSVALAWLTCAWNTRAGQPREQCQIDARLALDVHQAVLSQAENAAPPIGSAVPGLAGLSRPDPVHSAIAASRAAEAAMAEFGHRQGNSRPTAADFAEEKRLAVIQSATRAAALATVPTTRAGQLAMLEYVRFQMDLFGNLDGTPPDADSPIWADTHKALQAALGASIAEDAVGLNARPSSAEADAARLSGSSLPPVHPTFDYDGLPDPRAVTAALPVEAMPLSDMAALVGAIETIRNVADAVLCQPLCIAEQRGDFVTHSAAGRFVDWLSTALGRTLDRAHDRARQLTPSSEEEAEIRMSVLGYPDAICGDANDMRAYARDLLALATCIDERRAPRG